MPQKLCHRMTCRSHSAPSPTIPWQRSSARSGHATHERSMNKPCGHRKAATQRNAYATLLHAACVRTCYHHLRELLPTARAVVDALRSLCEAWPPNVGMCLTGSPLARPQPCTNTFAAMNGEEIGCYNTTGYIEVKGNQRLAGLR